MLDICIDNTLASAMLLSITDRSDVEAPEPEYESEYVEGRNGSVNRFKYFKDVDQEIGLNILEKFNVKSQLRKIKAWLLNAKTFYFTDDDVFRKIKKVKISGIKNSIAEYGDFTVTFTCDPFEYALNDEVITLNSDSEIDNFGTYKALPLIKLYGKGEGKLIVGTAEVAVNLQKAYMLIDSEIQECYFTKTNLGSYMVGEFPVLPPGKTRIAFTGGIEKVELQRRCRYL